MAGTENTQDTEKRFYQILATVPITDKDDLVSAFQAVNGLYPIQIHKMPQPPWKHQGYEHAGKQAWDNIRNRLGQHQRPDPISLYVHVPFCTSKCGFCDCLSVAMTDNAVAEKFVSALRNEIRLWAALPGLKQRPVTVLYFGGGTPNSLQDHDFSQILQEIKDGFFIDAHTQISVECTARLLTAPEMHFLRSIGINRISIGIQTLEEPLRHELGRDMPASDILDIIRRSKQMGFITCGDVIYGLPRQRIAGFIETIEKLIAVGIDGLSLYRFNVLPRNRLFVAENFRQFQQDEILNYIYFLIGDHLLTRAGYRKNHYCHFTGNDENLYYRHLLRGEDLLAMGPTADGIIGCYRFRHSPLQDYLADDDPQFPVLEGGMAESDLFRKIKPLTVQLMCAQIEQQAVCELNLESLTEKWLACRILEKSDVHSFRLLANGSWLIHQLLGEVAGTVHASSSVLFEGR